MKREVLIRFRLLLLCLVCAGSAWSGDIDEMKAMSRKFIRSLLPFVCLEKEGKANSIAYHVKAMLNDDTVRKERQEFQERQKAAIQAASHKLQPVQVELPKISEGIILQITPNPDNQDFFRQAAACLGQRCLVRDVRHLLLAHQQAAEALLAPEVIQCLAHHHPVDPHLQRTFAPEGEVCEDLDEPVVQHIMCGIHIAHITVAHSQHLACIEGIKSLSGRILSSPASFNQLYFTFQYQNILSNASSRRLSVRRSP